MTSTGRASCGAVIWLIIAAWQVPHLLHPAWGYAILLFAALVIVPLLLGILDQDEDLAPENGRASRSADLRWARLVQFPAALLLGWSCRREAGGLAFALALPWAGVLVCIAIVGGRRLSLVRSLNLPEICSSAGLIYGGVAAAWLLADRSGFRPLSFSSDIVLLTAVHFHFAGLLLPWLAGRALSHFPSSLVGSGIALAVIVGVPAVAVGITASQFGAGSGFETMAAGLMALGGIGVAGLQFALAIRPRWTWGPRLCWLISALSLAFGMVLAGAYGLRNVFQPWPWLDLPWMRALHGTANAFGFGLGGVLAWHLTPCHGRNSEVSR